MARHAVIVAAALTLAVSHAALAQKGEGAAHDLGKLAQVANTYKLTLDNLHKVVAINKTFVQKAQSDATLRQHLVENNDFQGSLDELLKHFENDAVLTSVVKAGGMTPRDYLSTTMAVEVSAFAAEGSAQGLSPAGQANVALAKAHPDDFEAFTDSEDQVDRASRVRGGRR